TVSCFASLFLFSLPCPPPLPPLITYTTLFRSVEVAAGDQRRSGGLQIAFADIAYVSFRVVVFADLLTFSDDVPTRRQRLRRGNRSEEHTSALQSPDHLVCRRLLEKKKPSRPVA